jgi:hypothetical protein
MIFVVVEELAGASPCPLGTDVFPLGTGVFPLGTGVFPLGTDCSCDLGPRGEVLCMKNV